MRALAALSGIALLAACGPIPVDRAERECFQRARLGGGSGGAGGKLSLTVSSDYLQGRDPSAVYDACVYQKSGQPPRQPLYTRTDWQG
jgi:hypothetical protein